MDIYQACVVAGPSKCPIHEETAFLVKARVDRLLDQVKSEPLASYDSTVPGGAYGVVDYTIVRTSMFGALYGPHVFGANLTKAFAALERGNASEFYANSAIKLYDELIRCDCSASGESPLASAGSVDVLAAISCGDAIGNRNESFESVRSAYEEMANTSSFAGNWPARALCS